jgi:hypothetical protein
MKPKEIKSKVVGKMLCSQWDTCQAIQMITTIQRRVPSMDIMLALTKILILKPQKVRVKVITMILHQKLEMKQLRAKKERVRVSHFQRK